MGRLLSDAIRLETGADVGLLNRGGIRAAIPRGPITPRIVYTAIPFEEDLYLLELTGAELLEILETGMQGRRRDMEISGFTCRRNQLSPDGEKIEEPMVNGEPLDPEEVYVLVTTGYLAQGNVATASCWSMRHPTPGYHFWRRLPAISPVCPPSNRTTP